MLETKPRKLINLGEVWQLGDHRIICGDATDPEIIKKVIKGGHYQGNFVRSPIRRGLRGKQGTFQRNN